MEKLIVSACLLGVCCRYDGKSKPAADIEKLMEKNELIPVCPEQLGGLATPRASAEIRGERVITQSSVDVTAQYEKGAEEALRLAKMFGCRKAVLKARSPSCGSGEIHNGLFDGGLTAGDGVTAALFKAKGIEVFREDQLDLLFGEE